MILNIKIFDNDTNPTRIIMCNQFNGQIIDKQLLKEGNCVTCEVTEYCKGTYDYILTDYEGEINPRNIFKGSFGKLKIFKLGEKDVYVGNREVIDDEYQKINILYTGIWKF